MSVCGVALPYMWHEYINRMASVILCRVCSAWHAKCFMFTICMVQRFFLCSFSEMLGLLCAVIVTVQLVKFLIEGGA